MNRSKRTAEMSPEDKSALLNDAVFYEIIFALGVSDHDPSDYCVWEHLNFADGPMTFYLRISVFLLVRSDFLKKTKTDLTRTYFI